MRAAQPAGCLPVPHAALCCPCCPCCCVCCVAVRDVFDHAFNVLGERCIRVDWSPFVVKNVISNLNFLMRIYRLTEQGQTHTQTANPRSSTQHAESTMRRRSQLTHLLACAL